MRQSDGGSVSGCVSERKANGPTILYHSRGRKVCEPCKQNEPHLMQVRIFPRGAVLRFPPQSRRVPQSDARIPSPVQSFSQSGRDGSLSSICVGPNAPMLLHLISHSASAERERERKTIRACLSRPNPPWKIELFLVCLSSSVLSCNHRPRPTTCVRIRGTSVCDLP